MPNIRFPRSGSMQFWPRKRAKRTYARVRSFPLNNESKPQAFLGYKVGMTHLSIIDNRSKSDTKGETITYPVTIVECPPLKSHSIRFYKKSSKGLKLISEIQYEKSDKELKRKISLPKNIKKKIDDIKEYDEIRVVVYTQPKLTGIGKKKPELLEIPIPGKDALTWAKGNLGKEISIKDIFKEGQQLDIRAITKGKGYQGPVKRFGVALRRHKSEKGTRRVGPRSGGWTSQDHMMHRVAQAGQTGYHQRTELNKLLLKIGEKDDIKPNGGLHKYGIIKNQYILIKGSIAGPKKRTIILTNASRPDKLIPNEAPSIKYTNI